MKQIYSQGPLQLKKILIFYFHKLLVIKSKYYKGDF